MYELRFFKTYAIRTTIKSEEQNFQTEIRIPKTTTIINEGSKFSESNSDSDSDFKYKFKFKLFIHSLVEIRYIHPYQPHNSSPKKIWHHQHLKLIIRMHELQRLSSVIDIRSREKTYAIITIISSEEVLHSDSDSYSDSDYLSTYLLELDE